MVPNGGERSARRRAFLASRLSTGAMVPSWLASRGCRAGIMTGVLPWRNRALPRSGS